MSGGKRLNLFENTFSNHYNPYKNNRIVRCEDPTAGFSEVNKAKDENGDFLKLKYAEPKGENKKNKMKIERTNTEHGYDVYATIDVEEDGPIPDRMDRFWDNADAKQLNNFEERTKLDTISMYNSGLLNTEDKKRIEDIKKNSTSNFQKNDDLIEEVPECYKQLWNQRKYFCLAKNCPELPDFSDGLCRNHHDKKLLLKQNKKKSDRDDPIHQRCLVLKCPNKMKTEDGICEEHYRVDFVCCIKDCYKIRYAMNGLCRDHFKHWFHYDQIIDTYKPTNSVLLSMPSSYVEAWRSDQINSDISGLKLPLKDPHLSIKHIKRKKNTMTKDDVKINSMEEYFKQCSGEFDTHAKISAANVKHSIPAEKLDPSYFKWGMSDSELRRLRHPRVSMRRLFGKRVPIKPNKPKQPKRHNQYTHVDKNRLSAYHHRSIMFEYIEEHPPMMNNKGMATVIRNFYKRSKNESFKKNPVVVDGEPIVYVKDDKTLPLLASLEPGMNSITENQLFASFLYPHDTSNDFLLVTRHDSRKNVKYCYVRELSRYYTVGHIQPRQKVYYPGNKKYDEFLKHRIQMFVYDFFKRKIDQGEIMPYIESSDVSNAFQYPKVTDTLIREEIKKQATFERSGVSIQKWVANRHLDPPPTSVTPEQVCKFESMRYSHLMMQEKSLSKDVFMIALKLKEFFEANQYYISPKQEKTVWKILRFSNLMPWYISDNFLNIISEKGKNFLSILPISRAVFSHEKDLHIAIDEAISEGDKKYNNSVQITDHRAINILLDYYRPDNRKPTLADIYEMPKNDRMIRAKQIARQHKLIHKGRDVRSQKIHEEVVEELRSYYNRESIMMKMSAEEKLGFFELETRKIFSDELDMEDDSQDDDDSDDKSDDDMSDFSDSGSENEMDDDDSASDLESQSDSDTNEQARKKFVRRIFRYKKNGRIFKILINEDADQVSHFENINNNPADQKKMEPVEFGLQESRDWRSRYKDYLKNPSWQNMSQTFQEMGLYDSHRIQLVQKYKPLNHDLSSSHKKSTMLTLNLPV